MCELLPTFRKFPGVIIRCENLKLETFRVQHRERHQILITGEKVVCKPVIGLQKHRRQQFHFRRSRKYRIQANRSREYAASVRDTPSHQLRSQVLGRALHQQAGETLLANSPVFQLRSPPRKVSRTAPPNGKAIFAQEKQHADLLVPPCQDKSFQVIASRIPSWHEPVQHELGFRPLQQSIGTAFLSERVKNQRRKPPLFFDCCQRQILLTVDLSAELIERFSDPVIPAVRRTSYRERHRQLHFRTRNPPRHFFAVF